MEKWLRHKKILLALLCTVFVFYVTYVNAENLTILGRNAISGKMDIGTFNAYSLYGETVNEEYENEDGSTLKVEDIVRDEIQTKISFRLDNQKGLLFSPDFTITDNIGNTYKGSFVTMNYDEINEVVMGVVSFEPIEPRAEELQFIVRNNDNNQEWVIISKLTLVDMEKQMIQ
ncbi:MAG: hypothetical protein KGZ38_09155 [Erysipelothrix sp.]|nr:hypothetical protein [Erysipelothrix sp.]